MGEFIIISKPNSYSIWVFFLSPESNNLYLPGPCFNVQMWPVLALPLQFEVLMVHSAGDGGVYHYFKTQFLLNLGVLFSPESDNLYLPGPCVNVQMWPVLALPLHFEVLMVHSAGHGGVYHYFKTQFLLNLGVLFFP